MEGFPANHTGHDLTLFFAPHKTVRTLTLMQQEPVLQLATQVSKTLDPLAATGWCSTHVPLVTPYNTIGVLPEGGKGCGPRILVSQQVAEYLARHPEAAPHVLEVYAPDLGTEGAVRTKKGVIVGTRRLIRYK